MQLGYAPSGGYLTGAVDHVQIFGQALNATQARGLYQSWISAPLTSSGAGVDSARWSASVPSGLEGSYQIDLTGSDVLGNHNDRRGEWGKWRGEIDTTAPRMSLTVNDHPYYSNRLAISGYVEDLNLTTDALFLPCEPPANIFGSTKVIYYLNNTLTPPGETRQRLNRVNFDCITDKADKPPTIVASRSLRALRVGRLKRERPVSRQLSPRSRAASCRTAASVRVVSGGSNGQIVFDSLRQKLYWSSGGSIMRGEPDGSQATAVLSGLNNPRGLAIDERAGKLYWGEANRIARANLDGSGIETLANLGSLALAIDRDRDTLYFAAANHIGAMRLSGENRYTLFYGGEYTFQSLAINPRYGTIYWIQQRGDIFSTFQPDPERTIMRSRDVSGNVRTLFKHDSLPFISMAIDPSSKKIYFGEGNTNTPEQRANPYSYVMSADLNGANIERLRYRNGEQYVTTGLAVISTEGASTTTADLTLAQQYIPAPVAGDPVSLVLTINNTGPTQPAAWSSPTRCPAR